MKTTPKCFLISVKIIDEAILVTLNLSNTSQKMKFNLEPQGFTSPKLSVLLSTFQPLAAGAAETLELAPFGALIAKVAK